jgi:cysteine desulfurase
MSDLPIYLDHHSTTPCDPRVVERMLPYFTQDFGNPAAVTHVHGRRAATALENARASIAAFFSVRPGEIYITASATEANNIVLGGSGIRAGRHVISSAIEHKSVLEPLRRLERNGVEVTLLKPDGEGFHSAEQVAGALRPSTELVTIMAANGEIGTLQPIEEIASLCRERGVRFHTDATQAAGKTPLDFSSIEADSFALSAHKFYGPKGVGALFMRHGRRVEPITMGGGQERNVRSGTVNVPGAVGMAAALEICAAEMPAEMERLTTLRNDLWDRLLREMAGVQINGPRERRLPGNLNASFARTESDALIMAMRRFSLSSGSACSSGERDVSQTLKAIGCDDARSYSSIRFGIGRSNTSEQMDLLVDDLKRSVARLREISAA